MLNLKQISEPKILYQISYEDILEEKIEIIKKIMPDWNPIESDDFTVIAQSWAYDDLYHRQKFNDAIKSMLLPYSTGTDLDNLAVMYGVKRLEKPKPTANYQFSTKSDQNIIIKKGTLLTSDIGEHFAKVCEDIIIKAEEENAEEKIAEGKVELDEVIEKSSVKTEIFVNPIPNVTVKALGAFENGSSEAFESDEDFRERILLSLYGSSTAGSKESYIYWARSADSRIKDAVVVTPAPGKVIVYILADLEDEDEAKYEDVKNELIETCRKVCSDEKIRPLTDKVEVEFAEIKTVEIKADIYLSADSIKENIKKIHEEKMKVKSFELGESLNVSWLYSMLHSDGVAKVIIKEPAADIEADFNQAVKITANLTYI